MEKKQESPVIRAVLFDYAGVLAEEGFERAFETAARRNGLDPKNVVQKALNAFYTTGYGDGRAGEPAFWQVVEEETGLSNARQEVREELLANFSPRPWVLDVIRTLRQHGVVTAILSDHTNWLDELEERDRLFPLFDFVFNSYYEGVTKRDPAAFSRATAKMHLPPQETLFVDDREGHVNRARSMGLHGIVFHNRSQFLDELSHYFPFVLQTANET